MQQDFSTIKIADLAEGHQAVADIQSAINNTMKAMRETTDNDEHKRLTDEHYDLIQAKKRVQNQMGNIVKQRRKTNGLASTR